MARISFRWVTSEDDRVCPFCSRLGRIGHWDLDTRVNQPESILYDGADPVWNLAENRSVVHDSMGIDFACRCKVEINDVDASDFEARIRVLENAATFRFVLPHFIGMTGSESETDLSVAENLQIFEAALPRLG